MDLPGVPTPAALLAAVRAVPAATAQQRLSGTADRDLSIALLRMEDADRAFVLTFVNAEKRNRVLMEIERLRRARLETGAVRIVLGRVIQHVSGPRSIASRGSWFRPRRGP